MFKVRKIKYLRAPLSAFQISIFLTLNKFYFFLGNKCVTEAATFAMVCLTKPVLETAIAAINELKKTSMEMKNE